jgi:hypothetical protein
VTRTRRWYLPWLRRLNAAICLGLVFRSAAAGDPWPAMLWALIACFWMAIDGMFIGIESEREARR